MSFTSKDAKEILVAGLQDVMFTINVDKGEIIKQVQSAFKM
jgi:PAB-dependent poly(A)-specific ribonuclease subunit 2